MLGFWRSLKSAEFWRSPALKGFLYGLSGPMMLAVPPPRPPAFSPLPDLLSMVSERPRPRLSPEEQMERAFVRVERAFQKAVVKFDELQPFAPAQAAVRH